MNAFVQVFLRGSYAVHNLMMRLPGRRMKAALRAYANNPPKDLRDPLRTRQIRATAEKAMNARFARMEILSVRTVRSLKGRLSNQAASDGAPTTLPIDPADAGAQFEGWFTRTMMKVLLDTDNPDQQVPEPGKRHFTRTMVTRSVTTAITQAYAQAQSLGIRPSEDLDSFMKAVRSVSAIEQLSARQYGLLRDMTFESGAELRKILQNGLRAGQSVTEISNAIAAKIKSVNRARARTIVRTEITQAHAQATLNAFERAGVQTVTANVEFALNVHGPAEPCPQCVDLAGSLFTIREARDIIPVHPLCQCGWIATDPEVERLARRIQSEPEAAIPSVTPAPRLKGSQARAKLAGSRVEERAAILAKEAELEQINAKYKEINDQPIDDINERLAAKREVLRRRVTLDADITKLREDLAKVDRREVIYKPEKGTLGPLAKKKLRLKKAREIAEGVDAFERMIGPNTALQGADVKFLSTRSARAAGTYEMKEFRNLAVDEIEINTRYGRVDTVVHELGHMLEWRKGGQLRRSHAFWKRRTADSRTVGDLKPDKFERDYTGRRPYQFNKRIGGPQFDDGTVMTEVLSTGMQQMYQDPWKMAVKDPDFFDFVWESLND